MTNEEHTNGIQQNSTCNMLKVRDDHRPLRFEMVNEDKFKFCDGIDALWVKTEEFGLNELRSRIEPWLTALFQSEHLSLLAGSGLTHAVHGIAVGRPAAGMSGTVSEGALEMGSLPWTTWRQN